MFLVASMSLLPAADPPKILVHAHRGGRALRPENTLPAFQHAIELGADVLELDMAVTKDNVIVVSHDPTLHTPICAGPREDAVIRTLTLAEIRQWDCGKMRHPGFPAQQTVPGTKMPTLDDVFRLANLGKFEYNIETKTSLDHPEYTPPPEEFARMVLAKIREYRLEKRVIVQSFDFRTLIAMRKLAPEIRLAALTERDQRDFPAIAAEAGKAEIISPEFRLATPAKVEAAHKAGLQVVPWTANNEAEWDRLVEAKVDAIITDDPAALIAYFKRKGLR